MTVYGDILFAENFIIGCALIYITAEVFGADLHGRTAKLRLAAGGVMCGLFAMLIFLPVRIISRTGRHLQWQKEEMFRDV